MAVGRYEKEWQDALVASQKKAADKNVFRESSKLGDDFFQYKPFYKMSIHEKVGKAMAKCDAAHEKWRGEDDPDERRAAAAEFRKAADEYKSVPPSAYISQFENALKGSPLLKAVVKGELAPWLKVTANLASILKGISADIESDATARVKDSAAPATTAPARPGAAAPPKPQGPARPGAATPAAPGQRPATPAPAKPGAAPQRPASGPGTPKPPGRP